MPRMLPLLALALAANVASAQPPASIPDGPEQSAQQSFRRFAKEWMKDVHSMEERHRANPEVKMGSTAPLITYRGYANDYSIELRPTGHASAPYVGLLRYVEHVYSCTDMEAVDCQIASSVPVTEVFRFQNGRWSY